MEADFSSSAKNRSSIPQAEKSEERKQYLKFNLAPNTTIMLPIAQLTEVMTIPLGQIVPIPHMKPEVMGVYNWRGEILWMVDLGKIVGLLPWYEQTTNKANYKAIVINIDKRVKENYSKAIKAKLGLVVSRVQDIKWCEEKSIHQLKRSPQETNKLNTFLQGYWLKSESEKIPILDGEKLLNYLPSGSIDIN